MCVCESVCLREREKNERKRVDVICQRMMSPGQNRRSEKPEYDNISQKNISFFRSFIFVSCLQVWTLSSVVSYLLQTTKRIHTKLTEKSSFPLSCFSQMVRSCRCFVFTFRQVSTWVLLGCHLNAKRWWVILNCCPLHYLFC